MAFGISARKLTGFPATGFTRQVLLRKSLDFPAI